MERRFHQLARNGVVVSPLGGIERRHGTVAADRGNSELALHSGAAVLVYPGGDYEVLAGLDKLPRLTSAPLHEVALAVGEMASG